MRIGPDVDPRYSQECIEVLASVDSLASNEFEILSIRRQNGGLFNYLLYIETNKGDFIYKKYLDEQDTPLFSPPKIPAEQRSRLAYTVQSLAEQKTCSYQRVIPTIIKYHRSTNSIIMEAICNPRLLIDDLSAGTIPTMVLEVLATAMAQFHQETFLNHSDDDLLANERFRDFKLGLQYFNIGMEIGGKPGRIIADFAAEYKSRKLCVTHGDLNSRNILMSPSDAEALWIIDFEQAHLGTPAFDLGYILSEIFISWEYFGNPPKMLASIERFLDTYFSVFKAMDRTEVELEITLHLASQAIYRFLGPSRESWTFYVEDGRRKELLIDRAKDMITWPVRPVLEFLRD